MPLIPLSNPVASREAVYSALFTLLSTATFTTPIMGRTTWVGKARKWVDPAMISTDQQPFLSQFEGPIEDYEWEGPGLGPRRYLSARLFCMARVDSGDASEIGSVYLSTMIQAIEQLLLPDWSGRGTATLGGLVVWARIEGKLLKVTGDLDPQAMVVIPMRMLIP